MHQWIYCYINGELVATTKFYENHSVDGYEYTFFGTNRAAANNFFLGAIDDIYIFNRVISAEEVNDLFNDELKTESIEAPSNLTVFPNPAKEQ